VISLENESKIENHVVINETKTSLYFSIGARRIASNGFDMDFTFEIRIESMRKSIRSIKMCYFLICVDTLIDFLKIYKSLINLIKI